MNEPRLGKRDRTRRKLIDAGMQVIAAHGEALTASDVVAAADVSNGTFYNHFVDRDDFIQTLARESLEAISEASADDTEGADPAWRFAVATTRVLDATTRQPLWGRAILRLAECPTPLHAGIQQYLRADLADGHRTGRFTHGDDPITVDLVSGTLMATIRRLISTRRPARRRRPGCNPRRGRAAPRSDRCRQRRSPLAGVSSPPRRTTSASTRQRDRLTTTGGPTKHP